MSSSTSSSSSMCSTPHHHQPSATAAQSSQPLRIFAPRPIKPGQYTSNLCAAPSFTATSSPFSSSSVSLASSSAHSQDSVEDLMYVLQIHNTPSPSESGYAYGYGHGYLPESPISRNSRNPIVVNSAFERYTPQAC